MSKSSYSMIKKGRINGSRHGLPHAKTTIFSKKDPTRRIIARGVLFVSQKRIFERGDARMDNWTDIGRPTSKTDAARQAGVEL